MHPGPFIEEIFAKQSTLPDGHIKCKCKAKK